MPSSQPVPPPHVSCSAPVGAKRGTLAPRTASKADAWRFPPCEADGFSSTLSRLCPRHVTEAGETECLPATSRPRLSAQWYSPSSEADPLLCNPCLRRNWSRRRASPGLWPGPWWSRFCRCRLDQQAPRPDTWTVPVRSQTQNTLSDSCKETGVNTQVGTVTTHALYVARDEFTLAFSTSAIFDISVSPLTSTDPRCPSHRDWCIGD